MAEALRAGSAPTDDERMEAALALAQGGTSPLATSLLADQRRATRRRITMVLPAAVVVGGLTGWLIAANDHDLTRRSSVPGWRSAVGGTLWVVGFLWCTVLVVRLVRSGWYRRQRERVRPFTVLASAQRKAVLKQLRGHVPVVQTQLPLVRLMAENVVDGVLSLRLFGAILIFLGGTAFSSGSVFPWAVFIALTAVFVVGTVSNRPLLRRARVVLATRPSPTVDGAPS